MQTKTKFIIIILITVLVVVALGLYAGFSTQKAGKFDQFAQALKEKGAKFYGAFWCAHCQAQKEAFGSAKKYLPYVECSAPNGNEQLQVCIDNKVEGYPSWTFKDGIKLSSLTDPVVCPIEVEGESREGICATASSKYYRTWAFAGYRFYIKSPADPVKVDNVWQFPAEAQAVGEIPMTFLAEQIQFTLPE